VSIAEHSDALEGLECVVGRVIVGVPTASVAQILEYEVTPRLPLSERFIGGIGVHEGRILISIELVKLAGMTGRRRTATGVLLHTPNSATRWVIEVHRIASFVHASTESKTVAAGEKLPDWLSRVRTSDGRLIGWLDTELMVQHLGGRGTV
jgi:chemotaxis signal transduction protein